MTNKKMLNLSKSTKLISYELMRSTPYEVMNVIPGTSMNFIPGEDMRILRYDIIATAEILNFASFFIFSRILKNRMY